MKIWIDDVRVAPKGYVWCKSVNEAKDIITKYSNHIDFDNNLVDEIELINILAAETTRFIYGEEPLTSFDGELN